MTPKMTKRHSKTGGARPGAGRKPRAGVAASIIRTVKLTPDEADDDDAARGEMSWAEWDRRARAAARLAAVSAVVMLIMFTASMARADTRYELDNLLPPDGPVSVVETPAPHIDMLATANEHRHDRLWQTIDVAAIAVSTASLVCDWGQTHQAAAAGWMDRAEANRLLGPAPSTRTVNIYFAGAIVANVALWLVLPKRYRSLASAGLIAVQANAIGSAVIDHASTLCGM